MEIDQQPALRLHVQKFARALRQQRRWKYSRAQIHGKRRAADTIHRRNHPAVQKSLCLSPGVKKESPQIVSAPVVLSLLYPGIADLVVVREPDPRWLRRRLRECRWNRQFERCRCEHDVSDKNTRKRADHALKPCHQPFPTADPPILRI